MSNYPFAFKHDLFPKIPDFVAPKPPESPSEERSLMATTHVASSIRLPGPETAAVLGLYLKVKDADNSSQKFCNQKNDKSADADAVSGGSHFHFLPGIDEVEIRWIAQRPDLASKVVMEVWSAQDEKAAIATKTWEGDKAVELLSKKDDTSGGPLGFDALEFKGADEQYPGKCPNAAMAPYRVNLTVTCKASGEVSTAWTYFDVLVHSMELNWGPETWIPGADIAGVTDMFKAKTKADEKALLKGLKGVVADGDPEVTAVATAAITLPLPSTMAGYVSCYEWYGFEHDFAFLRHKARWGTGPRIPMFARIFLKRADNSKLEPKDAGGAATPAQAGAALGPARILWDWRDETAANRKRAEDARNTDASDFVMRALAYKLDTAGEPPECRNCHKDRGGKRGSDDRIFPLADGGGSLPFAVTAPAARKWAAFSSAKTSGATACTSGVLFSPSRMACDSYQVTAMLATELTGDRSKPALDVTDTLTDILAANTGLPMAQSGMMTVQRVVKARYIRKGDYDEIDRALIDASYLAAGVKVSWQGNGVWRKADYLRLLTAAVAMGGTGFSANLERSKRYSDNAGFKHKEKLYERIATIVNKLNAWNPNGLDAFDQWAGTQAGLGGDDANDVCLVFPSRELVQWKYRHDAIQVYIQRRITRTKDKDGNVTAAAPGKTRWSNDKLKKWNKLKTDNPGTGDVDLRVEFYTNTLTDDERAKVDALAKTNYQNDGWDHWDVANEYDWGVFQYDKGSIDLIMEMCLLKLMEDAFEGVTFFHYINSWESQDSDGNAKARNWGLGGVAKTEMASDLGLKSMFFVWDHPDDERRKAGLGLARMMNGNVTAVHEFGHNLHLPHAFSAESIWMHDGNPAKRRPDPGQKTDSEARQCVMNYHVEDSELCGSCRLRLRGWALLKVDAKNLVGFDTTNPANAGKKPETRFATLRNFFTDLTA